MDIRDILKALADETRLRILAVLSDREFSVNETVKLFGMGQSRVSRHLKILSDAGLLASRRDGLWMFYTASDGGKKVLDSLGEYLRTDARLKQDRQNAEKFIRDRSRATSDFFDSVAEDWGAMKKEVIGDFDLPGFILNRVRPVRTAADLGCGTGDLIPALLGKAASVIGVDNSPKMLEESRRKYARDPKVGFRIGELEHLPLRDGEADLAVLNMVLHHLRHPYAALQEAHRVLRNQSRLVVADFSKHENETLRTRFGDRWLGFEPAELDKWLKDAGFTVESRDEHPLKKNLKAAVIIAKKP